MADEERTKILARTVLEILGKPKEHVEGTLKKYVESIKEDKNFTIIKEHYEPAEEQDDGMFSVFAELELETFKVENLTGFCLISSTYFHIIELYVKYCLVYQK